MNQNRINYVKRNLGIAYCFLLWCLIGCAIGVVVGLIGVVFHIALEWAGETQGAHPWLLWLLPIGGLLIMFFYRVELTERDKGTNFVLNAVRTNDPISLKIAPLIFVSTVITHLLGGSAGREGAALQLGGSIASHFSVRAKLDEKSRRILTMAGMSAGFSALFGTPLASVIFSMEVITVGIMHYSALVPCTLAALMASQLAKYFGIAPTSFLINSVPNALTLKIGGSVVILGVLCALVSMLFCIIMERVSAEYQKRLTNPYWRIFVGGCIIIALTYLVGTRDYNGAGMYVIARAIRGEARMEAFFLKIVFTALTLGVGYKGGEIVPAFFVGATFGCVVGPLIGLPASFAAGLGMVAVFCGVTNCPLTSIFLAIEMFGIHGLGYYALCCAVSYMLSGYYGLYSAQKIMYSKTKPEFIDRPVHH